MKPFFIASLSLNVLLIVLLGIMFFTNIFDVNLFKKSSPSVCSELYNVAVENNTEKDFVEEYGNWCLEMAK